LNHDSKPLRELTVLITGASGGIGSATALRFADLGLKIILCYHKSHAKANEIARQCIAKGAQTFTYATDLSSAIEVEKMLNKLDSMNWMPDMIINHIGVTHYGLLTDMKEEEWDYLFATNVKSSFLLAKYFTPFMIRQRFGRLIQVSSVWGISGASCEVAYSATKGALNAFTKSLAKELAPSGITVNAVAPGAVDTEMIAHLDEAETHQLISEIPAGRFAQPAEIAALIYFLCLPESGYINGQIISPNGAWLT
jgi:3-oxoacyl-[acyl-carrier protein] reductase